MTFSPKVAHFHRDNVAAAPGDVTAENEEEEKGDRGGMEIWWEDLHASHY